jgi:hypothetical protein
VRARVRLQGYGLRFPLVPGDRLGVALKRARVEGARRVVVGLRYAEGGARLVGSLPVDVFREVPDGWGCRLEVRVPHPSEPSVTVHWAPPPPAASGPKALS